MKGLGELESMTDWEGILVLRNRETGAVTYGGCENLAKKLKHGEALVEPSVLNDRTKTSSVDLCRVMENVAKRDAVPPTPSKGPPAMTFLPGLDTASGDLVVDTTPQKMSALHTNDSSKKTVRRRLTTIYASKRTGNRKKGNESV